MIVQSAALEQWTIVARIREMKKSVYLGFASLLLVSAGANAVSLSGQVGEHYTNLGVGMGTETSGLALSGNWAHNDDDGDIAGLGWVTTFRWGRLWGRLAVKAFTSTRMPGAKGMRWPLVVAWHGRLATASVSLANIITPRIPLQRG
jgi:hypothetical protein